MADRIEGWWTIGEAPNYEINDEGVVRHKPTGRVVNQQGRPTSPTVGLSTGYGNITRSVKKLVETGRKYQGAYDGDVDMEENFRSPNLRSEYRMRS